MSSTSAAAGQAQASHGLSRTTIITGLAALAVGCIIGMSVRLGTDSGGAKNGGQPSDSGQVDLELRAEGTQAGATSVRGAAEQGESLPSTATCQSPVPCPTVPACPQGGAGSSQVAPGGVVYGPTSGLLLRYWHQARETALNAWKSCVEGQEDGPWGHSRFKMFTNTVVWPRSLMKRVGGSGDGGKWLVGTDFERQTGSRYVVLSIGSHMDFSFEKSILKEVPTAVIYTFDCTVSVQDAKSDRVPKFVDFHRICLDDHTEGDRMTYGAILDLIGEKNVDLLKADIEGFEFKMWKGMVNSVKNDGYIPPRQVSFELHYRTSYKGAWDGAGVPSRDPFGKNNKAGAPQPQWKMAEMMLSIDSIGYRVLQQELNEFCPHCSEFTVAQESWLLSLGSSEGEGARALARQQAWDH